MRSQLQTSLALRLVVVTLAAFAVACAGSQAATRSQIVQAALDQVGAPYLTGGNTPEGFDSSGLVVYSYAKGGMTGLPHSAVELERQPEVSKYLLFDLAHESADLGASPDELARAQIVNAFCILDGCALFLSEVNVEILTEVTVKNDLIECIENLPAACMLTCVRGDNLASDCQQSVSGQERDSHVALKMQG